VIRGGAKEMIVTWILYINGTQRWTLRQKSEAEALGVPLRQYGISFLMTGVRISECYHEDTE
jgi:hypothetical protein